MPTGTRQDTDRTVLSVPEAAAHFGVTPDAIRARLHRKTLNDEKVAGEWRVYLERDLDQATGNRQAGDRTPTVDRQDGRQDATAPKQDSDRQGDSPTRVAELLAAKDETITRLDSEVAYLRDQLDQRSRELAAERERSDVIQQMALGRIPQLPIGDSGGTRTEHLVSPPQPQGQEIATNRDFSTPVTATTCVADKERL